MPWIIDVDHYPVEDEPPGCNLNAAGLCGPRGYKGDGSELSYKFRMYDGDDILYYEGRSGDPDDFGPLDDFGEPNAGCTRIDYQHHNGLWRTL